MRNKRSDIWKHIFKHWNALTILKLNYIMQKKKKIIIRQTTEVLETKHWVGKTEKRGNINSRNWLTDFDEKEYMKDWA